MYRDILSRADLEKSADAMQSACFLSREHSRLCRDYLAQYGNGNGKDISGIYRDHFPEPVKEQLRSIARAIAEFSYRAYKVKPRGVHAATIRKLGRAIAARDGTGFYGPQA